MNTLEVSLYGKKVHAEIRNQSLYYEGQVLTRVGEDWKYAKRWKREKAREDNVAVHPVVLEYSPKPDNCEEARYFVGLVAISDDFIFRTTIWLDNDDTYCSSYGKCRKITVRHEGVTFPIFVAFSAGQERDPSPIPAHSPTILRLDGHSWNLGADGKTAYRIGHVSLLDEYDFLYQQEVVKVGEQWEAVGELHTSLMERKDA